MQDYHKTAGAPLGKISWVTTILNSIHRKAWASETSVNIPRNLKREKPEEGIRAGRERERSRGGRGGRAGASRKFNLKEYLSFYIWSGTGRSWLILVGIGKDKIIFIRGMALITWWSAPWRVTRLSESGWWAKKCSNPEKKKYFTFFTMTTQQIQN